jgi:C-methyltransferase C-terminal domain/Putative zinc binding domain/Methyltransferase domain
MQACRICSGQNTKKFLAIGPTPLANAFLRREQLNGPEASYPLDVYFCETCGLVQLGYVVPPEILFKDYIYVSSTSDTIPVYFAGYADEVAARFLNAPDDLVVEMGSNDGCLLKQFRKHNLRTLGVEPAANIAKIASANGIETLNDFFCERTAKLLREEKGEAKVILGNNVFAHIGNLEDVLKGLDVLLAPDGKAIFDVPYLVNLLDNLEFDTIYHEHLSYFSVHPLDFLFRKYGFKVFDVKRVSIHGGSIRVYANRAGAAPNVQSSVHDLLALEKERHLDSFEPYAEFGSRVSALREDLMKMLRQLKSQGKRIAGYGAPAKGNTLLNYCKIGTDFLDYIVDKSPLKQNLYTPGMHIPVYGVEKLLEDRPDFVLILAWNFAEEIMRQQRAYGEQGGKFILPVPSPRIAQ